jgi:hypothetical protein
MPTTPESYSRPLQRPATPGAPGQYPAGAPRVPQPGGPQMPPLGPGSGMGAGMPPVPGPGGPQMPPMGFPGQANGGVFPGQANAAVFPGGGMQRPMSPGGFPAPGGFGPQAFGVPGGTGPMPPQQHSPNGFLDARREQGFTPLQTMRGNMQAGLPTPGRDAWQERHPQWSAAMDNRREQGFTPIQNMIENRREFPGQGAFPGQANGGVFPGGGQGASPASPGGGQGDIARQRAMERIQGMGLPPEIMQRIMGGING